MESHAPLQQIQVVDKYAYIAAYNLGLMIVDIEDSKNPSVVSTTRLNVNARAVSINNGAALVGGENTLFALDISDRAAPTISSGIELDDGGGHFFPKLDNNYVVWRGFNDGGAARVGIENLTTGNRQSLSEDLKGFTVIPSLSSGQ